MFVLALTVSEMLKYQIVDLEQVGQGSLYVSLQWYHSLTNIQICKGHSVHFCASSHRFRDNIILRFVP